MAEEAVVLTTDSSAPSSAPKTCLRGAWYSPCPFSGAFCAHDGFVDFRGLRDRVLDHALRLPALAHQLEPTLRSVALVQGLDDRREVLGEAAPACRSLDALDAAR